MSSGRGDVEIPAPPIGLPPGDGSWTTGRYLVLMRADAVATAVRVLDQRVGLKVARSAEFRDADASEIGAGETLVFDQLAVAVVNSPPDQIQALGVAVAEERSILAIEPERIVKEAQEWPRAEDVQLLPVEYLRGYQDATNELIGRLLHGGVASTDAALAAVFDETQDTWGLQATGVITSQFTGRRIKVAVLDTGLEQRHPDFYGRAVVSKSFVHDQSVNDGHGHGTHCIGTICGPRSPTQFPRYGIAPDAELFVGKVLNNAGGGTDAQILAGIEWALTQKCEIISMSLESPVQLGQGHSQVFEQVADRLLRAGTLIIAAAGNGSDRPGVVSPVAHPANCPSIIAVAALDMNGRVAKFSSGGLNLGGGQIDIAGPGVHVRSSWRRPLWYRTLGGTSMATPHVAGIAALYAESHPHLRGRALAQVLLQNARRLPLPSCDVGAGLVQAP